MKRGFIPAYAAAALVFAASVPVSASRTRDRGVRSVPKGEDDEQVRLGAVAGVGFPRPLSIAGLFKIERAVSLGVEYSYLPATTIAGLDLRYQAIAGDMRVFPLLSSFYLGLRVGRQHLVAASAVDVPTVGTVAGSMTTDTFFVNPRLGFLYTSSGGLSIGIEGGVQIPLNHTTTTSIPNGVPVPEAVSRLTSLLGNSVIPTVTLLQLGLLF